MTVNYIIEFNLKLDHCKALAGSRGQVLEIQLYIPGYKQAMSGGEKSDFWNVFIIDRAIRNNYVILWIYVKASD